MKVQLIFSFIRVDLYINLLHFQSINRNSENTEGQRNNGTPHVYQVIMWNKLVKIMLLFPNLTYVS